MDDLPVFVFYHKNCYDGSMAAAVFCKRFPHAQFLAYEYGDELGNLDRFRGHVVYLLDVTFHDHELLELAEYAVKVMVIDHHPKTHDQVARQLFNQARKDTLGFVHDSDQSPASGAQLAWRWCNREVEEPAAVRWVGKRDRWIFDEPEIRPFSFGLGTIGFRPHKWAHMFLPHDPAEDRTMDILTKGRGVVEVIDSQIDYLMTNALTWLEIDGHRVIAANAPKFLASELGQRMYETFTAEESPFAVVWYCEEGRTSYSLRGSPDCPIDLGELARKFGGGGHARAAGFKVTVHRGPLDPKQPPAVVEKLDRKFTDWLKDFVRLR